MAGKAVLVIDVLNELYRAYRGDLMGLIVKTDVYRTVTRLGLKEDLEFCLKEDLFNLVPYWKMDG